MVIWALEEAQSLIAALEPAVRNRNYHTMLGGGVLHAGQSEKDVDIFLCPLNGYPEDTSAIYDILDEMFGPLRALRDGPDYAAEEPGCDYWPKRYQGSYCGKRVDLFWL